MPQADSSCIYEVRAEGSRGKVHAFGARRTRPEAEELLAKSIRKVEAAGGRNRRYWIEEIDTTGLWQPPPLPKPRDRYTTRVTSRGDPRAWETVHVEILDGDTVIAEYDRNYSMLQTFEPFRQDAHPYALISSDYTATSALDLATGAVIAAEEPAGTGFCPVGFYVPDWHDLHDAKLLPGSLSWRPDDHQWPCGDFGFVWGCIWGDDSSWKVQYLDLSAVRDGEIRRDERFGYLRLAASPKLEPQAFICCSSWHGERRVEFHTRRDFSLATGEPISDEEL
jgi:hypothetical protein